MPKKMMPKSQAKNKTLFLQYPFLAIFNSKEVPCKLIYNLSFNCIMGIYSNVYNYQSFCVL